jgi:hypothetical protein
MARRSKFQPKAPVMNTVGTLEPSSSDENPRVIPSEVTLRHAFEIWINPELERRRAAGVIGPDFQLASAQVVLEVDRPPIVRLNEEIKTIMMAEVTRPVVEKGERLAAEDIRSLQFHLTEDDPNAAHFTLVNTGGIWWMSFDFRYNRARILKHLDTAEEFAACADFAVSQGFTRSTVDNLFSAAELTARAVLLSLPDARLLQPKLSHGYVESQFNSFGRLGNVETDFMQAFNRLRDRRSVARYLRSQDIPPVAECTTMLATIRAKIAEIRSSFDLGKV